MRVARQSVVVVVGICLAGAVRADDDIQDSWCPMGFDSLGTPEASAPWIVDDDVNDRIDFGLTANSIDNTEMERMFDVALQNVSRMARTPKKARVLPGPLECSIDDSDYRPCVEAFTNAEDPDGDCGGSGIAFATCGFGGCYVKLCQEHASWPGAFESGVAAEIFAHELAHAYGVHHVSGADVLPCTNFDDATQCTTSSDGCDGELMCNNTACGQSHFVSEGDSQGLRAQNGGNSDFSREVQWGRDFVSDGMQAPARNDFGIEVTGFQPRIACARSPAPTFSCAGVFATRTSTTTNVKVARLAGASGSASWATEEVIRTISVTSRMPPDIAINNAGTVAYVVHVDAVHRPIVVRVPLDGSATTTLSLASVDGLPITAVLPPRIEWADGQPRVLVYRARAFAGDAFGTPQLALINVSEAVTTSDLVNFVPAGASPVDLDSSTYSNTHALAGEFDLACGDLSNVGTCTIAAIFYHDDANIRFGRPRSIRFQIDGAATTAQILDANWSVHSSMNANAIVGATIAGGNSHQLVISTSAPIVSSTSTQNTAVIHYSSGNVGDTPLSVIVHRGDAETCSTTSGNGENFGAAGMLGGYSVSWCPTCPGGTSGTLESVGWGDRQDGNTNCY